MRRPSRCGETAGPKGWREGQCRHAGAGANLTPGATTRQPCGEAFDLGKFLEEVLNRGASA
ncbi:MAG: hypothetical protein ACOVT5_08980 [Armatimonadaceae bacterium]